MKLDREKISTFLDDVQKNPFHRKDIIIDGFDFHVHYDNANYGRNYFCVTIFFTPSWPHSNGFMAETKEKFLEETERFIEDARKIFTNGGKFPADFHNKH